MVEYNIKRSNRIFEIWDRTGKLQVPNKDETIKMYEKLNSNYPDIDSLHYKKAKALDIDFFVNSKYPYDYIVLGDRAAIEEARKGSYLTPYEEHFITLGYGYDGRPFGEPWGIEIDCFEGYKYAESQGDFLHWYSSYNYYEKYLNAGYNTPYEYEPSVNRDLRELAERKSAIFRKEKYGRITKKILIELGINTKDSIIRVGFKEDELLSNKIINFEH